MQIVIILSKTVTHCHKFIEHLFLLIFHNSNVTEDKPRLINYTTLDTNFRNQNKKTMLLFTSC